MKKAQEALVGLRCLVIWLRSKKYAVQAEDLEAYADDLVETLRPRPDEADEVLADVLRERQRQLHVESWTPEHDDSHSDGALAQAAACYAAMKAAASAGWPT